MYENQNGPLSWADTFDNIYTLLNTQLHKALCLQKSFVYKNLLFAERHY